MIAAPLLRLWRNARASAAAEMALVTPLMLILICGSAELGNYFMNEHNLIKAVRDGARFAARQSFSSWPSCSTVDSTVRDNTRNVVMYGYLSGTTVLTPNISAADINVTTSCTTTAGGQTMSGVYKGRAGGAQVVTVSATVPYRAVVSAFGFTGVGMHLNASSQATVTGL
jgi:Flp pilus assembly protein TadG